MATIQAQDIPDLVAGTLRELGRMRIQNVAQELTEYHVFPTWFKKDKVQYNDGYGIQKNLLVKAVGNARHVGLYENDQTNIEDVIDQLRVDWVHIDASWSITYQTDILMNRGASRIVDIVKARRASAMLDFIDELERKAFYAPGPTETKLPYGLPYWIVKNASQGYNGGYPTGHTTIGGVNLSTVPKFKNWTDTYSAVSKASLVKNLRRTAIKVNYRSPIKIDDYMSGAGARYRHYVNDETYLSVTDVGEGQNENLGRDIASMDGVVVLHKHPIINIPILNEDTTNPWYFVDNATFYPVVLKGNWMKETEAIRSPNNRNVYNVYTQGTYNYLCLDRRRNAVLYYVAP